MKPVLITTKGINSLLSNKDMELNNIFIYNIINRPELFDTLIEVDESIDFKGKVINELSESIINKALHNIYKLPQNTPVIIAFLNSSLNPLHEIIMKNLLQTAGYTAIHLSHEIDDWENILN